MLTTCVVCNSTNPGMMNIYKHPNNLDQMLNFVTDHKVECDDHLCILCYDELKVAFNFKQKYRNSQTFRASTSKSQECLMPAEEVAKLEDQFIEIPSSSNAQPLDQQLHDNEEIISTTIQMEEEEAEETESQGPHEEFLFDENLDEGTDEFAELSDTRTVLESLDADDALLQSILSSDENGDVTDENLMDVLQFEVKCTVCTKTFTKKGSYHRHMKQQHSMSVSKRTPRDKHRRGPTPKYTDDDIYKNLGECQCEYCFVTLESVEQLHEHESLHKIEERPYHCNQKECTSRFKDRYSVRCHIRIHSSEKRFKCRFCGQGFHQHGNLKAHERCHTGEKPYVCTHCGKGFAENGNLKAHIRFHTGERPYACDYCPKKFRTHYSHKIHVRSHTHERPFECEDCGKSFNCSGKLRIHQRIHTGDRPYRCDVCGASFMDSSRLRRHAKRHPDDKVDVD